MKSSPSFSLQIKKLVLAPFFLLFVGIVTAAPIYKSIGKNGHVTYSSTPMESAVRVELVGHPRAPDPREIERARERLEEFQIREAQLESTRREQQQEALRQRQIQEDLALKRKIANQKPVNVVVINQAPGYRPWSSVPTQLWPSPDIIAPDHWRGRQPPPSYGTGNTGLRMWNNNRR